MASTHKHIRSSTADKRPTTAIAEGQIALNTNSASPGLFFKDSTGTTIIKVGPVHVGSTAPNATPAAGGSSGNSTGEVWLDDSLTPVGVKIWDGSAWVNATLAGSTTVQGLLELATDAETQAGSDTDRAVTPAGLQSKVSDSTSTTSSTTIASSTAVKSAYDLANAALPTSGGTVTGELLIGNTGSFVFEGSTDDAFETTLAVTDPTADRTITFPDRTGTVITNADTGTVTSTMIADGTIVNADVNASAAIALSKLATGALPTGITVASANIVDGTIVNADVNASAAIAGTKISPDFGGQNVVTTGNVTGAALIPSSSVVPTNGVYLPSTNTVAFSTNSTGQVFLASGGNLGVGTLNATNVAGKIHARADGDESKSLLVLQNRNTGGSAGGSINFVNGGVDLSDNRYSYIRGIITGAGQNGNHIIFGTNSNGQAPTEKLRITSDGKLGVGTSSPQQILHTTGASNSGFVGPRFQNNNGLNGLAGIELSSDSTYAKAAIAHVRNSFNGQGDLVFYNDSNNDAADWATGDEKLRITSDGRVGIGTATVRSGLHIYGTGQTTATISDSGDRAAFLRVSQSGSATGTGGGILFASEQGDTANSAGFAAIKGLLTDGSNNTAGTLAFSVRGTASASTMQEAMRIDGSGRLLVGASSAFAALTGVTPSFQVQGTGEDSYVSIGRWTATANNPGLVFNKSRGASVGTRGLVSSGDNLGSISFAGDDGTNFVQAASIFASVDGTPSANDMPARLSFATTADGANSPTERMRITSDGVIYIGQYTTATPGVGNTTTGTGCTAGVLWSISRNNGPSLTLNRNTSDGSIAFFQREGTLVGRIDVTTTSTSYITSSDYRLKENVVPLTGAADRVKQIPVHRFNFIADPDTTVDGFIAHEAQAVVPECVTGTKDEVDDEGNPVYQGIDQSKIVPLLTAALQEALAEIESLKARLTAAGI